MPTTLNDINRALITVIADYSKKKLEKTLKEKPELSSYFLATTYLCTKTIDDLSLQDCDSLMQIIALLKDINVEPHRINLLTHLLIKQIKDNITFVQEAKLLASEGLEKTTEEQLLKLAKFFKKICEILKTTQGNTIPLELKVEPPIMTSGLQGRYWGYTILGGLLLEKLIAPFSELRAFYEKNQSFETLEPYNTFLKKIVTLPLSITTPLNRGQSNVHILLENTKKNKKEIEQSAIFTASTAIAIPNAMKRTVSAPVPKPSRTRKKSSEQELEANKTTFGRHAVIHPRPLPPIKRAISAPVPIKNSNQQRQENEQQQAESSSDNEPIFPIDLNQEKIQDLSDISPLSL